MRERESILKNYERTRIDFEKLCRERDLGPFFLEFFSENNAQNGLKLGERKKHG